MKKKLCLALISTLVFTFGFSQGVLAQSANSGDGSSDYDVSQDFTEDQSPADSQEGQTPAQAQTNPSQNQPAANQNNLGLSDEGQYGDGDEN